MTEKEKIQWARCDRDDGWGGPFYAVVRGRHPGIYSSWDECKAEVFGFPWCQFKKFSTYSDAKQYLDTFPKETFQDKENSKHDIHYYKHLVNELYSAKQRSQK